MCHERKAQYSNTYKTGHLQLVQRIAKDNLQILGFIQEAKNGNRKAGNPRTIRVNIYKKACPPSNLGPNKSQNTYIIFKAPCYISLIAIKYLFFFLNLALSQIIPFNQTLPVLFSPVIQVKAGDEISY